MGQHSQGIQGVSKRTTQRRPEMDQTVVVTAPAEEVSIACGHVPTKAQTTPGKDALS